MVESDKIKLTATHRCDIRNKFVVRTVSFERGKDLALELYIEVFFRLEM